MFSLVDRLSGDVDAFRREFRRRIMELPDNPDIARLALNAIAVSSSDVFDGNHFSAEFYDFKRQYETLADWVDSMKIENVAGNLHNAIRNRWYKHNGEKHYLHPTVVIYLEVLIRRW